MVRRAVILLLLGSALCCFRASAQELYDYAAYKRFEEPQREPLEVVDSTAVAVLPDLKREASVASARYNLSFVRTMPRGRTFAERAVLLNGIDVPYISRSDALALNLRGYESTGIAWQSSRVGRSVGATEYRSDTVRYERTMVGVSISSRRYLAGIDASTAQQLGRDWYFMTDVAVRTGRDMHIEGVYTSALSLNMAAVKQIDSLHRVALTLFCAPTEQGTRRSSTAEAFQLLGDNLYNPSWGYQNGRVRNANVRREVVPHLNISYIGDLRSDLKLDVAAGATIGRRCYSALEWYDAQTPIPDNYRYMPSYCDDEYTAEAIADRWRADDASFAHIDYAALYTSNRLQEGAAVYALADRVELSTRLQLRAALTATLGNRGEVVCGITGDYDRSRNYKLMSDLLGADYHIDIDYFIIDDDTQSNRLQNNTFTPDRRVADGDRFGYDFALTAQRYSASAIYRYTAPRLRFEAGVESGYAAVVRRGYYRKELFAESSYGRSRRLNFSPYALRLGGEYRFGDYHLASLAFAMEGAPPQANDLFLQSEYNNRAIDAPSLGRDYDLEAEYLFNKGAWRVAATLFLSARQGYTDVTHQYDDVAREYCDVVVRDIDRLSYGVEASLTTRFASHWYASLAASLASYRYSDDAKVELYADRDNHLVGRTTSRMKWCRVGNAPQVTVAAELSYRNRGWRASLSGAYAGLRYIAPSYLLRTERVLHLAASDEAREAMISQERLRDAMTFNLSLSKRFLLARNSGKIYRSVVPNFLERHPWSSIVVMVAVQNLFGSRNIVYSGYESSRLVRHTALSYDSYSPQASRYMYAYPRSFYMAIRFSF